MKTLKIYMENGKFVIEDVEHSSKRSLVSENELKKSLDSYVNVMDQYELEVSEDLWGMVFNYVSSKEFLEK